MNRRASCVGTFEVFEAAHVALRTLLAFSQPVNCIFWPIGMLNWLVAASKLHKHRETCCTAEWPFYSFLILCFRHQAQILNINYNKHLRMSKIKCIRMFKRMPNVIDNLSIFPVVTRLFQQDKVALTYRQVSMIK